MNTEETLRYKEVDSKIDRYLNDYTIRNNLNVIEVETTVIDSDSDEILDEVISDDCTDNNCICRNKWLNYFNNAFKHIFKWIYRTIKKIVH